MARIPKPWKRASNGRWYVQLGGVQHDLGTKKKEAYEKYHRLMVQRGVCDTSASITLHELLDRYEQWLRQNRAASTVGPRMSKIKSLRAFFPKKRLKAEDVKPYQIEEWARTPMDGTTKLSPTTVHDRIRMAVHVFNRGKKMGLVAANPLAGMEAPTPRMRRVFIPPERFDEFFAAIDEPEMLDYVVFLLESGCRPAEIHDLQIEYLEEKAKRVIFPIDESKGRRQQRTVHLNDTALAVAVRLKNKWKTGHMFRNARGRRIQPSWVTERFGRLKEKMDIPELCATVLRHSFCYARLTAGQNPVIVAKLMGHIDTRMVEQRYGHLDQSPLLAEKAGEIDLTDGITLPDASATSLHPRARRDQP